MKDIRDSIATVLDGIKATAGFDAVYYDNATIIATMPAVMVVDNGGEEEFETNQHNSEILSIRVRIVHEKIDTSDNDKGVTDTILDIADAVMTELRKKSTMTLSGITYYLRAASFSPIVSGELGNIFVLYKDIDLEVKAIRNITS